MSCGGIHDPVDCIHFTDNVIIITDSSSMDIGNGEVIVLLTEDSNVQHALSFGEEDGLEFPIGLCQVNLTFVFLTVKDIVFIPLTSQLGQSG